MRRALALSLLLGVLWACDPSVVIGTCGDGGIGGGMAEGTGGGGGTATPKLRVFATSGRFTGNLGGLSGADQKCMLAAAAGNKSGTWKAYVSSSSENALAFGPAHRQTAVRERLTAKTGRVDLRQNLACADTLSMAGLKTAPRTATLNYISSASSSNERRRGSSSQS